MNQRLSGVPASGGFGFGGTNSTLTTDLGVTQNLFDSGRTRQQVRATQARSRGALEGFGSARSELAFAVAQRFYEQLRQEKLTEQFQRQVALAGAQTEVGTAARVDILGVQVTLQQARFDLVTAQNNLATARVNFRNVLGLGRGPALQLVEASRITSIAGLTSVPAPNVPVNPAAQEIAPNVSAPEVPATNAAPQEVAPNALAPSVPETPVSQEVEPTVKVPELPQLPAATEILNIAPPDVPQLESLETYLARAGIAPRFR